MAHRLSPAGRKAALRFLALVLVAFALQGMLLLITALEIGDGDGALLLWAALVALTPVAAILVPCWAALGGVHPLAAFFPIGLAALIFPGWPNWLGWVCLPLSLVSAVAGQEWKKRRETEGTKRHARTGRKQKRA